VYLYQHENAGALPPDLDALQKVVQTDAGANTWQLFTCPYASARGNPSCASGAACASWYVYCVPAGATNYKQIINSERAVCAYEPLSNHDGEGMMVLYWDGHVTWHDAGEAKKILDELQAGHNPPRAEELR
jgi:prepilin-type processing-associated H-X9-DG protein